MVGFVVFNFLSVIFFSWTHLGLSHLLGSSMKSIIIHVFHKKINSQFEVSNHNFSQNDFKCKRHLNFLKWFKILISKAWNIHLLINFVINWAQDVKYFKLKKIFEEIFYSQFLFEENVFEEFISWGKKYLRNKSYQDIQGIFVWGIFAWGIFVQGKRVTRSSASSYDTWFGQMDPVEVVLHYCRMVSLKTMSVEDS